MKVFEELPKLRHHVPGSVAPEMELFHFGRVIQTEEVLELIALRDIAHSWRAAGEPHQLINWHDGATPEERLAIPVVVGLGALLEHCGYPRVLVLHPDKPLMEGMLATAFRDVFWPAGARFLAVRDVTQEARPP